MRGDDAGAAARFADAVAAAPDWAWLQVRLARARAALGDEPGAVAAAHEAQRLAPRWWEAIAAEARAHRDLGHYDLAIEHYRRALELAPEEPALLAELALVYHVARLDTEAERYAHAALALDPDVASARLLLAERALEARDGKAALAEADRLVSVNPRSVSGQLARADALALLRRRDEARDGYRKVIALEDEAPQHAAPEARLAEVRAALAAGKLPAPRGGARSKQTSRQDPRSPQRSIRDSKPADPTRSPRPDKDILNGF
ncbi:MAG: tetratricopeptide repeat protein [Kofleriaceae bacterium]|nr:tetratricopeptide repeat protein [Kofleriaceae bacterium]